MVHNPHRRARAQATLGVVIASSLAIWTRGVAFSVIAGAAMVFCLLAWLAPGAHAPIQRTIDRLSAGIVWVASWLTLGFVYFCIFTPLRVIARAFGRDPLDLRGGASTSTHFKPIPASATRRFERQF